MLGYAHILVHYVGKLVNSVEVTEISVKWVNLKNSVRFKSTEMFEINDECYTQVITVYSAEIQCYALNFAHILI